jgi:hypothetical protein
MPDETKPSADDARPAAPAPPAHPLHPAQAAPAASPSDGPSWTKWVPLVLAAVTPALFFFLLPPLTTSGLWDPYELNVADLARRVGFNL